MVFIKLTHISKLDALWYFSKLNPVKNKKHESQYFFKKSGLGSIQGLNFSLNIEEITLGAHFSKLIILYIFFILFIYMHFFKYFSLYLTMVNRLYHNK